MPSRTFPSRPESIPAARGYVADVLADVPPELCQTAALLVSELATNTVRHAAVFEFAVEVRHLPAEGLLWIGVTDSGPGVPLLRTPSITSEHGRGVRLVATLATRWGARRRRGTQDKTVWFELALPATD